MVELVRSLRGQPLWTVSGAAVLLALAVLPFFLNGYGQQVMMIGYFYVMLGISWNILAGYTGQFSLAQHAFATIAGYTSAAFLLGLPCYWQMPGFYLPLPCAAFLPTPLALVIGILLGVFLVAALGTLLLNGAILHMKIGYRMRAIRDDQELAVAAGVDVVKWKRLVFMISTAMAGLAGTLYGHAIGLLTPTQSHFTQMAFVIIAV